MSNQKILIVEDELELRKIMAWELENLGYEVFLAGNGEEGFQLAQEVMPDLIITDVLMPKVDGNQLLKKLRESASGRRIPFIVISARGKMRDYFETMKVDAFLEKPFEHDDLLFKIEQVLAQPIKSLGENSSTRKRVLILENEPWLLNYLRTIFQEYGYEACNVKTVGECLEEAVRFHPDIIIFKYFVEEMNADRLVELLRKMPHLRRTPILVYSQTIMGGERDNVLEAGATDFLTEANAIKLLKRANQIFHFE